MQNNLNFQKTIKTRKNEKLAANDRATVKPAGKVWKRTDKRKMVD